MRYVTRKFLDEWLTKLASEMDVVAPVNSKDKLVYQKISAAEQIVWDFQRTDMSPRNWYFPMTESILLIEQGKETKISEPPAPKKLCCLVCGHVMRAVYWPLMPFS